ncbi:MAG: NUDIX hydrolase [Nanoarchaeota archaeon]
MEKIDFSKFNKGIFMINAVGIVYNKKLGKVLIGKREKDPYVESLFWSFPGGRIDYNNEIEDSLKEAIKKKTGIDVRVKEIIFARITPEIDRKQAILYYYCETEQEKPSASDSFVEVKWVDSKECKNYFTTSVHPNIIKFLDKLK